MILTVIYATMEKIKCFNCGEVGHLIRACPGKNKENNLPINDTGSDGESVKAGPSNAVPPVAETGAVEEGAAESPPASESAAIQVTDPNNMNDENRSVNAEILNTQSHKSVTKTDKKVSDSALQPNLFCDGIEMEAEQSEFKIPSKRKKSSDIQAVRAKKADVEDVVKTEWKVAMSLLILASVSFRVTWSQL